MTHQQMKDIAWRRCLTMNKAAQEAERECRSRGKHTSYCLTLVKDARKLKDEYERVCKNPPSNPLSIKHGEKFEQEKIIGDLMGRNGPDTHHSIGGDKNRRGK